MRINSVFCTLITVNYFCVCVYDGEREKETERREGKRQRSLLLNGAEGEGILTIIQLILYSCS